MLPAGLTIAHRQQAKSWELWAAMSLARLWQQQGECDEARDLLAPSTAGSLRALTPPTSWKPTPSSRPSRSGACALPGATPWGCLPSRTDSTPSTLTDDADPASR